MVDLFIIAGEASGDLLGEGLLQALYHQNPSLKIAGIGGLRMRKAGMEIIFPMEKLQVMGFIDVLFALPHLIKCFRKTVRTILQMQPKAVVTIDYPGFNLRLARTLRKKGYRGKICHYVCPSVWAWGKKRISLMSENLDLLLSILPFEKKLFSSLRVEYIGHPLATKIAPQTSSDPNLIAFFPGSRKKEIERNLPFMMRLMKNLVSDYRFAVSLSSEKYRRLIPSHLTLLTPEDRPFLAVAKSGTVTLELALKEIPTVVIYAISPWDVFIARHIFKISLPFYALPNIIAGKAVFPELIGPSLTDDHLLREVKNLIAQKEACKEECRRLRAVLGTENSSFKAAELILTLLKE